MWQNVSNSIVISEQISRSFTFPRKFWYYQSWFQIIITSSSYQIIYAAKFWMKFRNRLKIKSKDSWSSETDGGSSSIGSRDFSSSANVSFKSLFGKLSNEHSVIAIRKLARGKNVRTHITKHMFHRPVFRQIKDSSISFLLAALL